MKSDATPRVLQGSVDNLVARFNQLFTALRSRVQLRRFVTVRDWFLTCRCDVGAASNS